MLKKVIRKFNPLLQFVVVLPTVLAILYYGLFAADIYTSESSFVIRSSSSQSGGGGFGAFLRGIGISRSQDDSYTVQEYMLSRSGLKALAENQPIKPDYEGPNGDVISRFGGWFSDESNEGFYQYYRERIARINFDPTSGIASLKIDAFQPEKAQQINQQLLETGEQLINRLNTRAKDDLLNFWQQEIEKAEMNVRLVAEQLNTFRNKNDVFDVKAESTIAMNMISKLQDELVSINAQLAQIRTASSRSSQIKSLTARKNSIQSQINRQMRRIVGNDERSLSSKSFDFQRLQLDQQLAEKQLTSALASMEDVRAEIGRQQLYLSVISAPDLPDMALKPKRFYGVLAVFVISLLIYGIVSLLLASVREHKD